MDKEKVLLNLLIQFYEIWIRCESSRGCYSCCEQHDCRCDKARNISNQCVCGRDEIEKLSLEIDKRLKEEK